MARKKILLVDESELFRDYLRDRLAQSFEVETAVNGLDGVAKLRSYLPDLLILDYHLTRRTCREFLEEKNRNPNAADIPVILTSQQIDKGRLLELVPFRIRKVLMKPLRIDALFEALGEILGVKVRVDETPCIVEAHVNDNIVFIEIAKGLNREKIDLLRFKIRELLDLYQIAKPRILVMMSDIELSFVDGPNIELLLGILLSSAFGKAKQVKILTISSFMREFVKGRPAFAEVEVLSNLQHAIDGLLSLSEAETEDKDRAAVLISERILSAQSPVGGTESVEMRFQAETARALGSETLKGAGKGLTIAVVDDDFVIQELVKTTFAAIDATVSAFSGGRDFVDNARSKSWDLVFLDILMPEMDGFQVLARLREERIELPVIILSAVSQREAVLRAVEAGVKSYLIKPLRPDQIMKKTLEILRANF